MKGEITLEEFAAFDKAGLTHPDPDADEADTEGSTFQGSQLHELGGQVAGCLSPFGLGSRKDGRHAVPENH